MKSILQTLICSSIAFGSTLALAELSEHGHKKSEHAASDAYDNYQDKDKYIENKGQENKEFNQEQRKKRQSFNKQMRDERKEHRKKIREERRENHSGQQKSKSTSNSTTAPSTTGTQVQP